jgi:hypothetical protein
MRCDVRESARSEAGPRCKHSCSGRWASSSDTCAVADWTALYEHEAERYRDGEARLNKDSPGPVSDSARDERQRRLTRMGNAAWGAGLCLLMEGKDARPWLELAAGRWRESFADAPPGSWGRPIGAIKALVLAGDRPGAEDAARWALAEGAAESESPIGRYAAALACSVLGDWGHARIHADAIRIRDDFPRDVGDALATIAAEDVVGYVEAVESVLESFESRDEYLEDVPVADTVIVLQALAASRNMAADLSSDLLP